MVGDAEFPWTGWGAAVPVRAVGIVGSIAVLVAAAVADPVWGLTVAQQRVLGVFGFALVLWLTEPVPYVVSSLLAVTLLFGLGVVDSFGAAATGYASRLVFFLLALLLLGNAITGVGLDRALARRLLSAESTPRRTVRSIAGGVFGLGLLMPSAMARAVTLMPLVEQLRDTFGLASGSDFDRASFLILGHVNPIASMALMTGGGMPLVTSEIVTASVRPVTWVRWAILMVPPTALLYALATLGAVLLTDVDGSTTIDDVDRPGGERRECKEDGPTTSARDGRDPDGAEDCGDGCEPDGAEDGGDSDARLVGPDLGPAPLTREQRVVSAVMIGAIAAWVVGSFLGVPTVLPAVVAVAVLALPGVEVITADDAAAVSWGVVFLIGAMLSILDVMGTTGALDAVVGALTALVPLSGLAHWQVVAALLLLCVAIRIPFSTASAAIVVALPIALELAGAFGVDRLFLALSVLLVVGATTLLPFNTTAVLVSMDRGPLSHGDVARFGLVTMALSLVVVVVSWRYYWPLVT